MNSLTIPSLTLEQLKKTSKNLKQALSDLGTDITHSTALNLTSRGVGFKDYNTAKAFLGKNEVVFDVGQTSPQPSQYAYTTMLYDLKSKDLFGVHLPIIKGFAMGIEADGAIGKDEAKALGIELAVNLDWQAPKPIERNISMIYDNAGGFLLVNVDEYDGLDQFFELVFTYRKFGVKRLALVSRDRIPQSLYDACVKNKVHFAQSTSPLGVFVELRHKNKPSAEAGVTHVPKAEFKELVSRCGLGEADAEKLTEWYHALNGGWIEYKLLVKGVMFDENDSLFDMQRILYEDFIYSMCLGLNSAGNKTKTEHWESYINKTAWAENAQRMFTSGITFNKEIADALDMNYHDALKAFNQERNRYTKGLGFWPKELIDQPRTLSAKDVGADLEIRDLSLIDYYSLEDMMLYFRASKKWVNNHIVQKIHKRDTGYFSGKSFYKKTAIEGIAHSWPDYNPQKNLKRGGV